MGLQDGLVRKPVLNSGGWRPWSVLLRTGESSSSSMTTFAAYVQHRRCRMMISYLLLRLNWFIWNYMELCSFILYVVGNLYVFVNFCSRDYTCRTFFGKVHWFHGSDMSWFILIPCRRWLLAIHDLLKQARPDSLKGHQLAPGSECVCMWRMWRMWRWSVMEGHA